MCGFRATGSPPVETREAVKSASFTNFCAFHVASKAIRWRRGTKAQMRTEGKEAAKEEIVFSGMQCTRGGSKLQSKRVGLYRGHDQILL